MSDEIEDSLDEGGGPPYAPGSIPLPSYSAKVFALRSVEDVYQHFLRAEQENFLTSSRKYSDIHGLPRDAYRAGESALHSQAPEGCRGWLHYPVTFRRGMIMRATLNPKEKVDGTEGIQVQIVTEPTARIYRIPNWGDVFLRCAPIEGLRRP